MEGDGVCFFHICTVYIYIHIHTYVCMYVKYVCYRLKESKEKEGKRKGLKRGETEEKQRGHRLVV